MNIYLQKIRTDWTKKSRGEPLASKRHQVPQLWPVQLTSTESGMLLQEILFSETTGFQKPVKEASRTINNHQVRQLGLEFENEGDMLIVFQWKRDYRKELTRLNQNQCFRLITNRRVPLEHTSGYYREVINIFFGELSKAHDILKTQPYHHLVDQQTTLY